MTSSPTDSTEAIDQLATTVDSTGKLIDGVGDDQWSVPTPCDEWTVRQLVNHIVLGNLMFSALLRAQAAPDRAADHLGEDPSGAFRAASADVLGAFALPGALEATYQAPIGPAPGMTLLHLRIIEHLVHGWDLARATGQPVGLAGELAEQELAFSRARLAEVRHRPGAPFGSEQPAPGGAPALDRLAAYLGRPLT